MSEVGVNPDGQISGFKEVKKEIQPDQPLSHKVQDALLDDTPQARHNRRTFLGGLLAGGLGLTALGTVVKEGAPTVHTDKPAEASHLPQSTAEREHLNNQIVPVLRTEKGLEFSRDPNVAQYIAHPDFAGIDGDPYVKVRTEIDVTKNTNVKRILATDLDDLNLGLIRVAGEGFKANNDTHDDPHYCISVIKDNMPVRWYEWLAFADKVDPDPDNMQLMIDQTDGTRSIQLVDENKQPVDRDNGRFIGVKFVNTTADQPTATS